MMASVRLPRLLRDALSGAELLETGRLHPSALSVTLNLIPLSQADMTLEEDDLTLRVHDLVEIYGQNGSLGIYRVTSIATTYAGQRKVSLNHALDVLSDAILPGEDPVTGTVASVLGTLLAAQTAKLGGQSYWQLGTVEDTATYTIDNRYNNVLDCLTDMAEKENGYYFAFDFGTFPWTLHFLARNSTVMTEFRLPRNVENCRVTLDDGEQCTRLYLSVDTTTTDDNGEKTTTTHAVYDDAAGQAEWGVISKKEGIDAADVPDVSAWVQKYFDRYREPSVQIEVDGLELYRLTGEQLDEVHMGRLCRVALPDYDTVFGERIVTLNYPDLLRTPERVRVSLANKKLTAAKSFSSLNRSASDNAASSRRNYLSSQQNSYSLRATDRHVTEQGEILHAAGLEIDPHGVWLFAKEEGVNTGLGAEFKVQADGISALVQKTGINDLGENETLYSYSHRTAEQYESVVGRVNGHESRIRQTETDIELKADNVTVTALRTTINNLMTGVSTAQTLRTTRFVFKGNGCDWFTVNANNGIFRLIGTYDE